ncbi:MAG: SLOG family protein [Eubacteriales bacterium]
MKTCCFFGSPMKYDMNENNKDSLHIKNCILENIINLIENKDVTHFISGMGTKIGIYAAETILKLKKTYPQCTLECAVSCETQAARWPAKLHERFYKILEKCDKETMIQKQYSDTCRQVRNEYMIDRSDYVIAVWNGRISSKAIYKSVKYAKSKDKTIIIIDPTVF